MKILTLDIETAPNIAHVWRTFKENVGMSQLVQPTEILCWAAKFYGADRIYQASTFVEGEKVMLDMMHQLLSEADIVVTYNGKKFDIPHLNRAFLLRGDSPPRPYKQVDLYQVIRSDFQFPIKKLDYVVQELKIGAKVKHAGHELWVGCLNDDPDSWETMLEYNRGDVTLTEALYERLRPWIITHPNAGVYSDGGERTVCPKCGSTALTKQGFACTPLSKFQQYKCKECGGWCRGRKNLLDRTGIAANVAR